MNSDDQPATELVFVELEPGQIELLRRKAQWREILL
jgi:hypothetical protein